jgi:glucose uptake protein GlcU
MVSVSGYSFLAAAVLCNGSFLVPFKAIYPEIPLDPIIFQIYSALGIFVAHWLALAFLPYNDSFVEDGSTKFRFSGLAVVAGVIMSLGIYSNFLAATKIGMSLTQGISAGAAVITSYFWATVIFKEHPDVLYLSLLGLLTIVFGITLLALCKEVAQLRSSPSPPYSYKTVRILDEESKESPANQDVIRRYSRESQDILFGRTKARKPLDEALLESLRKNDQNITSTYYAEGATIALISGILGGSILAPMHYVSHMEKGLVFLPAFGTAVLGMAPVLLLLYMLNPLNPQAIPTLFAYESILPGMFSGFIWSANNVFVIAAIDRLGYGLAIPLVQCSVLVAALWGVLKFGELQSVEGMGIVFFLGASLLVGGASMLAVAQ